MGGGCKRVSPKLIVRMHERLSRSYAEWDYCNCMKYVSLYQQIMAYFTICLWLVPFTFFISLSANENVLPTTSVTTPTHTEDADIVSSYFKRKSSKYGLLSFLKSAQDSLLPQRVRKQYWCAKWIDFMFIIILLMLTRNSWLDSCSW